MAGIRIKYYLEEDVKSRWIDHFKKQATEKSAMSRDVNTKVGAVIIAEDDMVEISSGYNCLPRGVAHNKERSERPMKYLYTSHAEASAIANAARLGRATKGSTIVVTMFPCTACMALIINAGITKIVSPPVDTEHEKYGKDFEHSLNMAHEAGVVICEEIFE